MEEGKTSEGSFFSPPCDKSWKTEETWSEAEYSLAVSSLLPTLPHPLILHQLFCPPFLTATSSGWDWSSSRLPQTGLRVPMASAILWGFGSVTAAWLIYGTLITPPPGGLRGARRVTSGEREKTLRLYMGIILKRLSSGQLAPSADKRF